MRFPEKELIGILRSSGVDFTASLPCEKIKILLEMLGESFPHIPLTREEEGVGICAGAALAGRRPALFVQSSGIGNMINALLSLTAFYELPLAIFVSRRGIYQEKIAAQFPMGLKLPGILKGAGISFTEINRAGDFSAVGTMLDRIYEKGQIHAFLLSPEVWEGSGCRSRVKASPVARRRKIRATDDAPLPKPKHTRFELLEAVAPLFDGKAVICNLGFPAKELYCIRHQPSNFYMLGSMGMVSPIGLGVSLSTRKEVIVIDGDGSLLMNPGTLATAASLSPRNLTVLAIDNGAYGSTGNQPTLTSACVDLAAVASGFGFRNVCRVCGTKDLVALFRKPAKGMRFIHAVAVPGNRDVPTIDLPHLENRRQVQAFFQSKG